MPRPPSQADVDLSRRLELMDVCLSPADVQTFREVGLLMAPTRVFPGGGGSGGRYPPDAIQRAKDAIAIRKKYPASLAMAVAVMFVRNIYPMDGAKVRRALVRSVEQLLNNLQSTAGSAWTSGDPLGLEAAGEKLAKRAARDPSTAGHRRNIRRNTDRRRMDTLAEIMEAGLDTFRAGTAPAPARLAAIAEYAGMPHQIASTLTDAMAAQAVSLDTEAMALDRVRAALRVASWEDIQQARADAQTFGEFILIGPQILALVINGVDPSTWRTPSLDPDSTIAAQTAINISRMQLDRVRYYENMKFLRVVLATYRLLICMPAELRVIAEAAGEAESLLTVEEVAMLDDFRARFANNFPDEHRVLREYNQGNR